jgi:hypothetical protein
MPGADEWLLCVDERRRQLHFFLKLIDQYLSKSVYLSPFFTRFLSIFSPFLTHLFHAEKSRHHRQTNRSKKLSLPP